MDSAVLFLDIFKTVRVLAWLDGLPWQKNTGNQGGYCTLRVDKHLAGDHSLLTLGLLEEQGLALSQSKEHVCQTIETFRRDLFQRETTFGVKNPFIFKKIAAETIHYPERYMVLSINYGTAAERIDTVIHYCLPSRPRLHRQGGSSATLPGLATMRQERKLFRGKSAKLAPTAEGCVWNMCRICAVSKYNNSHKEMKVGSVNKSYSTTYP